MEKGNKGGDDDNGYDQIAQDPERIKVKPVVKEEVKKPEVEEINIEAPKTITTELNRIQKTLKAPKNQKNTYGGFNYRSAEDIIEAYKPIAGDTVLVVSDDVVLIGNRIYVVSTVQLQLGEQSATVKGFAREPDVQKGMNESQITGSASSYAKKYALNHLFAIDDSKDADFTEDEINKMNAMEIHESEISMIDDLDALKVYYETHKGLGKEFGSLVMKRKLKIQNDNPQG